MFKEKVNARTDGRTTDTGPWHKLAGLRPVELKMKMGFFVPMFQLVDSQGGASFDPRGKFGRGPQGDAIYQISKL